MKCLDVLTTRCYFTQCSILPIVFQNCYRLLVLTQTLCCLLRNTTLPTKINFVGSTVFYFGYSVLFVLRLFWELWLLEQ